MKQLVVYYSKTGTTAKVARELIDRNHCDFDEIKYDEGTKTISCNRKPSDYEHIVLMAPIWAFSLAEPMKQYIAKHGREIKQYDLVVTCGGLGLRGCVGNCKSAIGKPPENAMKIRAKLVSQGDYSLGNLS